MAKKRKPDQPPASAPARPPEPFADDLFAAEIGGVMETDLHGLRLDEARAEIERFIHAAFIAGERAGRIVHGRGAGALRQETHRLLAAYQKNGIVAAYRDAQDSGQIGGVTVFALSTGK